MKSKFILAIAFILYSLTLVFAQQTPVKIGDKAPDFTLADQKGKQVKLSKIVKKSNLILVFYRGYWWPYCLRQLAELRKLLKENEKTQIFGISVDKADKLLETIQKIETDNNGKVNFQLLSDADSKTIDVYGLRSELYKGKSFYGIPKPAVLIINKKQKITWMQIEEDYKLRPKNETLRVELDKLK